MPVYIQKIDRPGGLRQTSHSPDDDSSGWRSAWFRATVRRLGRALEGVEADRRALLLDHPLRSDTSAV